MIFLAVLALGSLTAAMTIWWSTGRLSARPAALGGMAAAMVVAGGAHWFMPTPFIQHLPPWVPAAEALVLLTGAIEVALGVTLLLRQPWRRRAGLSLAAYFVAVFPANVYVAVAGVDVDGQPGGWYPWLRLPLQALFVVWALWSTEWNTQRLRTATATLLSSAAHVERAGSPSVSPVRGRRSG